MATTSVSSGCATVSGLACGTVIKGTFFVSSSLKASMMASRITGFRGCRDEEKGRGEEKKEGGEADVSESVTCGGQTLTRRLFLLSPVTTHHPAGLLPLVDRDELATHEDASHLLDLQETAGELGAAGVLEARKVLRDGGRFTRAGCGVDQ
jgi:hypothetical protein